MRNVCRAIKIAGVLAVLINVVGVKATATGTTAYEQKAAKLLESIKGQYLLGTGDTDDCQAALGAKVSQPEQAAFRAARTAPSVAPEGQEQCPNNMCQADWGTGINVCFNGCDWANAAGSIWLHCCCIGECEWGWC